MIPKPRPLRRSADVEVGPDALSPLSVALRVENAAVSLSRTEQWMLDMVRRRGTFTFVASMTLALVAASLTLTLVLMGLFFTDASLLTAGLLGAGVPALLAPLTLYGAVRLAVRLNTAGQLLRLAALTDPLTCVLNRRGFFERVDELAHSGRTFAVAMVDLDDFKKLNDLHGHATGDLVLKQAADWLVSLAGETGVVARMGGDEFALLVPSADAPRLPNRQSLVMEGVAFNITLGSTELVATEDLQAALARADAALYGRKRN